MASKPADRNNAEANTPKGVRKVNLSELKGSLSKRGRSRYTNPVLAQALLEMLSDGEPLVWDDAVVDTTDDKTTTASRAKWRQRAISVFDQLAESEGKTISIGWTTENEMVISLKA